MKSYPIGLKVILSAILCMQPMIGYAKAEPQNKRIEQINEQMNQLSPISVDGLVDLEPFRKKRQDRKEEYAKKDTVWKSGVGKSVKVKDFECQEGCCACTVITPEDFEEYGTYVIDSPGKYTLQQDVIFNPTADYQPGILILSNDVTLDLCSHTFSQGDQSYLCNAIQIGSGYANSNPSEVFKNIEIRNGNITHFNNVGIYAYNATFEPSGVEQPFEDLRFLDLNILYCGSSPSFEYACGIDLETSSYSKLYDLDSPVDFLNIKIERCHVNNGLGNIGIFVYGADGVVISDTTANDLSNPNGDFQTFGYWFTVRNLQMSGCQGNRVRQENLSTGQCGGLLCQRSVNVYVKDSQFNDAYGEAASIVNTNPSNVINGVFENCQFNNSRGGASSGLVAGLHMSDSAGQETEASSMKFINCQFNGARGGSQNCGISAITLKNIFFENCEACDIHGDVGYIYGFEIASLPDDPAYPYGMVNTINFKNCTVTDLSLNLGYCAGFAFPAFYAEKNGLDKPTLYTNITVDNCVVERVRNNSSLLTAGIMVAAYRKPSVIKNILIRDCTLFDIYATRNAAPAELAAGIFLADLENPIVINNNVTDCVRGVLFTTTDFFNEQRESVYVLKGLVQDNRVTNCLISGYQDDRCPTASAWINNVALLNGTYYGAPSHEANYRIKWPKKKAMVDEGTLGKYPKCSNKYYNLSLIYDDCN